MHGGFALPHAHGLNQYNIITGGLTDQHGFAGLVGHTAQRSSAGAGTDIGIFERGQALHAGLVAQDGAAGNGG